MRPSWAIVIMSGESGSPFGDRLRQWRQRRGLSQLALAGLVGSTTRHLSFLELGRLSLAKGEQVTVSKRHVLRSAMTTRRIYPGRHQLEVRINGHSYAIQPFWII